MTPGAAPSLSVDAGRPNLCVEPAHARFEALALAALHAELTCYPKPGLVSLVDPGSHADMDASTFLHSIESLRGYFASMAAAGAAGAGFAALNALGRTAERRMLEATRGRNTHRGAIFTLGLLTAAAATCSRVPGVVDAAAAACATVGRAWGREILAAEHAPAPLSNGAAARWRYGVSGAREEAAGGCPTVLPGLAALRAARAAGADANAAAVQALFAIVAVLPDNNLLHRGGPGALAWAQAEARGFLAAGGVLSRGWWLRALDLHRRFVAARLSPGGAADLLAAVLFLDAWETEGDGGWVSH